MSAALDVASRPGETAGFPDPVFDAQAVFRTVLDALARPGRPTALPTSVNAPAPLTPELASIALALCDHETAVWLDPVLAGSPDVADYLRFQTGCRLVDDPAGAAFALLSSSDAVPPLTDFAQGSAEYPDRSTTLIVAADDLSDGDPIRIAGPGIRGTSDIRVTPLPPDMAARLAVNHALFPRGIDLLFVAGGQMVGVPRSSRIVQPGPPGQGGA